MDLALLEAAALLNTANIKARIALLPSGCDPGDADASVICDAIRNAKEHIERNAVLRDQFGLVTCQ